jgi:hypothetical protein
VHTHAISRLQTTGTKASDESPDVSSDLKCGKRVGFIVGVDINL